MIIHKIPVITKNHSYDIYLGNNIFNKFEYKFYPFQTGDRCILVTNQTIFKIWKKKILQYFSNHQITVDTFILADGENHKTLYSINLLLTFLLEKLHDRRSILIAFGGGVIGDITGFAASIYQRGIRFVQLPTTFLSQVDAAIGGKTGVNHELGKNMIGTFWQPESVITNIEFLNTLPYQQLISGLAEVIKYAISFDYMFFEWLEKNIKKILSLDPITILYCIQKCCKIKSKIVNLDEHEKGCRLFLNLGHTYGHAIEAYFKYTNWLHGEAVAIGMVMSIYTSQILGIISFHDGKRMISLIKNADLPIYAPRNMSPKCYLSYMMRDKKSHSGKIKLIIPSAIGKVKILKDVNQNIIFSAIQKCLN
ncbi:3-dehydroquinate synthase [Buchnera aphidicola]|uniref:3-dehydroquinate synthase n=1 Tax=Buchnera aphidicola (Sarucallis kahawaluokalani) TaxID=1241878 RepID=A0A4D6YM96_9GAMM|nr:3-dehydroquinate synthase [Buchnera aphidicola]QCI26145.1 3-dehydroquinate synthase [Buchnera aphidicola (Sarucallis kahawaluokalani)]